MSQITHGARDVVESTASGRGRNDEIDQRGSGRETAILPGLPRPSRSDRLAVTVAAFLFGQGDDLAIAAIRESIEHNYRVPPDPWRIQ